MECYDDTTEALSKPSTYFLLSNTILQEEEPKLLAEMSSPRTETEIYKMSLEPLIVIESGKY